MIGWINLSVESFILKAFGEEAWNKIVAESGVQYGWVSSCPYPDKITYDLVITAARILGVSVEQALEAYGVFFVSYVTEQGYTKLLKTLGSNIVEFLGNLNNLHLHLTNGQPAMEAPAFRVENVTSTSCHLHYVSTRPALWPIVVGVLKGLSQEYLHYDLEIELLQSRDKGDDHEVFLIKYPPQADVRPPAPVQSAAGFTLSSEEFAELHPFHLLLDKDCCLLQFGHVLPKLVPGIAAGHHVSEYFTVRHPHTSLTWDGIRQEICSSFVLMVQASGLELKGQMVPTCIPVPGCPMPRPVMLFMGSPRCSNLDEMLRYNLFLSDIPLHDLSRDFVLLAEQRQAEAELKEKFEKLTLELKAEKARSDALVQRMSGLLACFPFRGGPEKGNKTPGGSLPAAGSNASGLIDDNEGTLVPVSQDDDRVGRVEVIEAVRRTLNSMNLKQSDADALEVVEVIGEGTYGKVYKALWQGTEVAVKTIVLPANMSGSEKREKMAIMEAAISSSLSHPNIVQTYTYIILPIRDGRGPVRKRDSGLVQAAGGQVQALSAGSTHDSGSMGATTPGAEGDIRRQGAIQSYEVKLVLELCDKGSLRDALEEGAFLLPDASLNYAAILDTAMDIAKACIHLHRNNVLHCDLKARNVLLRGTGGALGRGCTAKISDFGLAIKLSENSTHIDNIFQGTLTHMAPEVLTEGQVSKASDVYAYGITLWELFTGGHAFKGVPKQLLGHQVTVEHRRPDFPLGTPARYKQLVEWCWNKDTHIRPTFEEILPVLLAMRKEISGPTPPLRIFGREHAAAVAAAAEVAAVGGGSLPGAGASGGLPSPGASPPPPPMSAGGRAVSPGALAHQQQWGQGPSSSTGMWVQGPGSMTAVNTAVSMTMGASLMHGAGAGKPPPKFDPHDNSVSYMPSDSEGDMSDDD